MTFDELLEFLSDWYETAPGALRLPPHSVPAMMNGVVREFYILFGALAQKSSPFGHADSHLGPLSAQDHFYPADELSVDDGCSVHLLENQGNYAAGSRPDTDTLLLKGDVGESRFAEFVSTSIPLEESLVACALMETVLSVGDRDRLVTAEDARENRARVLLGSQLSLCTVYDDSPFFYWFTSDLIAFGFDENPEVFARRGAWRLKPPRFQDIQFEGGGSSSSSPRVLTRELEAERERTLEEARASKQRD